jgi:S-adenosylmethionine decarboxylase
MPAQNNLKKVPPEETASGEFTHQDGIECAGTHLLIDLFGASRLDEIEFMEDVLRRCVEASHATLLHLHCHQFSDSGGLSAVAVLAESHITVHTWPERDFAAFDVFMCGAAQPQNVIAVLQQSFQPAEISVKKELRGASIKNLDA